MDPRALPRSHELALATIAGLTSTLSRWPSYRQLLPEFDRRGLHAPEFGLHDIAEYLVEAPADRDLDGIVRITASGWNRGRPESPEIHEGFVLAVRRCFERVRFGQHDLTSVTGGPRITARELRDGGKLPVGKIPLVGLLLESEEFGALRWDRTDRSSPFSLDIDEYRARAFGGVGYWIDYEEIKGGASLKRRG